MNTRAAVMALACLSVTTAAAQTAPSMEQVAPSHGSRAALGVSQVSPAPARDRTSVSQLEKGLADKGLRATASVSAPATTTADVSDVLLAPVRVHSDSVDADEIARLLETGEAASIDAAAAIASTTARERPVAEDVSERIARARQQHGIGRP